MRSITRSFVDPAILIWDVNDYRLDQGRYWELASDVVDLLTMLEASETKIVARPELLEILIDSFPCEYLLNSCCELRDFSNAIFGLLAKDNLFYAEYSQCGCVTSSPELVNRPHFSQNLKDEVVNALGSLLNAPTISSIFSNSLIGIETHKTRVESTTSQHDIICFSNKSRFSLFENRHERIYEGSVKHDPLGGFGSKLPICLSDNDLQNLLDASKTIPGKDFLCVWSTKSKFYIIFRPHINNCFHAYAIRENELSKMGINPSHVHQY